MKSIIEKYKYIIYVIIGLFIILRISMSLGVVLCQHNLEYYTITSLQIIDLVISLVLIYVIYIAEGISLKNKNQKKKFKLIAINILLIGLLFESIISEFYYFQDPVGGCRHSELCEIKSLLFYSDDDSTVFTNNNSIVYYKKLDKGWKVDNSYYSPLHQYNSDKLKIQIYELENKYFVYVTLKDDISVNLLNDNTESEFELMTVANSPDYSAYGRYGKIIDSLEDYTIIFNEKEIRITDMKNN